MPGYLSRNSNTSDNRLPKVVEDFQISLYSTDQSDAAATGAAATGAAATGAAAIDGGHWLNSREMSLFDQSEAEWVLQKPRKKKSDTVNANSASHSVAGDHRWDNIQRIDQGFSALSAGNNEQALKIADELEELLKAHGNLSLRNSRRVNQLKARALFKLGRFDDCLQVIGQVKPPLDKGVLLTRGRALQATHRFCEALPIFKELYINHSKSNKDKKVNGLALGRLYQDMGLDQEALTIFRKLRTDLSGHEDIPCNNKVIELTLGRLYKKMGRHREALTIFKKLRTDCSGHENTPCNDKDIELALGRLYQDMGLHQEALTIFNKLRTDRSGHENTPCNDKDIELALGRQYQYLARHEEALLTFKKLHANCCGHEDTPCSNKDIELTLGRQYQYMGLHQEALNIFNKMRAEHTGDENAPCNDMEIELALGRLYQQMGLHLKALTILMKLRTDRSGHEGTPCKVKEIELALGDIYVDLLDWRQFDQMQLDVKWSTEPEVDLCISVRYFRECIVSGQDKDISGLLAKAIEHACNAIEKSHYLNASAFSQLGHCLRIAALLPGKAPDIPSQDELNNLVADFFAKAGSLAPDRQDRLKNEGWRQIEHDFLASLSSG